jgi:predicted short-subunit dehydrogenase-like oxidoreductase (DUF2520 family)
MPTSESQLKATPIAIVGAGALGTTLARRLAAVEVPVGAVLSRTAASAQALADRIGAPVGTNEWTALPPDVRTAVLCVPDDAIADVARTLAALDHPWDETVVAHTSGVHTAEELAPLAEQGAAPLSFHPLQTVPPGTPPEALSDIVIGIEGAPPAVRVGKALARTLGARPLTLSAAQKARYHCAAALASNGLVALMGVVQELMAGIGAGDDASAVDAVAPLVDQTWDNLEDASPERVLTGPVARGDRRTVAAHLEALADEAPHLGPVYAGLTTEMVRLAARVGHLDAAAAESLVHLLQTRLQQLPNGAE